MNRLEEIQEIIKNFIYEKQQMNKQITEIENERNKIAQERNSKVNEANATNVEADVSVLGKRIAELGDQSQELQNKLDTKYLEIKKEVNVRIDNLISEGIRDIRKIEEQRKEIEDRISAQDARCAKYEVQKQEFFERFGRMPELSANAERENKIQEQEYIENKEKIELLEVKINEKEQQITELAKQKRAFKNGNWALIVKENQIQEVVEQDEAQIVVEEKVEIIEENLEETVILPLTEDLEEVPELNEYNEENIQEIETQETEILPEVELDELEPIQEIKVEEIQSIEEIELEEIAPIQEIKVEEVDTIEEIAIEEIKPIEEISIDEINVEEIVVEPIQEQVEEVVAELIEEEVIETVEVQPIEEENVEEVVVQPIQEENVEEIVVQPIQEEKIEEIIAPVVQENIAEEPQINEKEIQNIEETKENEIITFEKTEDSKMETTPFGEKVTLTNIIAKFEEGEVLYKAQLSNGKEINVYPRKATAGNIILKDKENREELKEILINYAVAEYRTLDKKVIKKIDPIICEVLVRFAKLYNYDAQNLIYNYAMSFSKNEESEIDSIPTITYNISYMEGTKLNKKEKEILTKICKNAKKNEKIDIIGCTTGLSKIRYILKRTFNSNNANALPEGKY